jgi:hypothetical protein
MMATVAPPKKATGFPSSAVFKALQDELIDIARNEAQLRGIGMPNDPKQIVKVAVPMDSLTIVDAILVIEPIIKFPLHDNTVRTGGYNSVEEALGHLMPRIERAWVRKQGKKNGSTDDQQN